MSSGGGRVEGAETYNVVHDAILTLLASISSANMQRYCYDALEENAKLKRLGHQKIEI